MIRLGFHKAVATVLGLGYAPFGPGTFGTLGAVLSCYAYQAFFEDFPSVVVLVSGSIIFGVVGIWSTEVVSREWGDDPSRVVMDEYVGYLISLLFIPLNHVTLISAFILFRFFDILKPLGIGYIDKNVKGSLGVMLDDVLAGVYSCITLHLLVLIFPQFFV